MNVPYCSRYLRGIMPCLLQNLYLVYILIYNERPLLLPGTSPNGTFARPPNRKPKAKTAGADASSHCMAGAAPSPAKARIKYWRLWFRAKTNRKTPGQACGFAQATHPLASVMAAGRRYYQTHTLIMNMSKHTAAAWSKSNENRVSFNLPILLPITNATP